VKKTGITLKGYRVDPKTGKLAKSTKGMNLCKRIAQNKSKKIRVARGGSLR
jgi:hypothetical protein